VAVYVDGDRPGAQKLGARFHVSGYPTMILFTPDGAEVTRLPGEVEPQRYTEVVTLAMNAQRPVKAVLASAEAGAALQPGDWRLLAFYAWDSDEQQLVPKGRLPALLTRLAAACPATEGEAATRLWLKAIAAGPGDAARDDLAKLVALLDDERRAREQFDVLVTSPAEIARAVSARGTPARAQALAAFERTLQRLEHDTALSRADRLGALAARVELARVDVPPRASGPASAVSASANATRFKGDAPLLADVRETVARADREITDGYERQAVITAGADLLAEVGLDRESDALLQANLTKSHSPYYLMSGLADNAAKRGDAETALRWRREAYERSEGLSTRLQWGSRYVSALIELAPADERRIEAAVDQVLDEAARQPDAFYERSAASMRRMSNRLHGWNRGGSHASVVGRFEARLGAMCDRLERGDAQRETCRATVRPAPIKAG
jgi:hypothetical protein